MVSSTPAGSGLPIGLMPGALPSDHASRHTLNTTAMRLPVGHSRFGWFIAVSPTWSAASKLQGPCLLYLRQGPHRSKHLGRQFAIDLDQCDGITPRRVATDVKRSNVDARLAQNRGEAADESGFVEIRDVDH